MKASQTVGTSVASKGAPSIAPRMAPFNFEPNRETVPEWISFDLEEESKNQNEYRT